MKTVDALQFLYDLRLVKPSPQHIEALASDGDIYPYGWSAWWCRGKLYDHYPCDSANNLMDAITCSIIDEILKEEKQKSP